MVTFFDGATTLGQVPLNNGQATLVKSNLSFGFHVIRAAYASDTRFAASASEIPQVVGPIVSFQATTFSAAENAGHVDVQVSLIGSSQTPITLEYATSDAAGVNACSLTNGAASSRCDYSTTRGKLTFNPGDGLKTISIPIVNDAYAEGNETLSFTLSNVMGANLAPPATATLTITDDDAVDGQNPIDQTEFFVRQHYLDFLNREPDTAGFNFWNNEIDSCGANAACIEVKRINVSAAFFFAIEFQETGYLVYRVYKSAFGNLSGAPVPVNFDDFMRDTQKMQEGFRVNIGDWEAQLEANKRAYVLAFVQRAEFLTDFPNTMTAQQFVEKLNTNAEGVLSPPEIDNLVELLDSTPSDVTKRSQVLRAVAEDNDLRTAEFRKGFVLTQYFGYLRRNPNDLPDGDFTGFNFWLTKLNQFNGNFIDAEMVKAFISSLEYRRRFGP
jgi:hypothetical protein